MQCRTTCILNHTASALRKQRSWPSGLRRCVKAAVFWAWVRIPSTSLFFIFGF
ncbi:hypothetical protein ACHAXH_007233 [Discostella pseudostelligera]